MLHSEDTYRHYLRQLPDFRDFTPEEFSETDS